MRGRARRKEERDYFRGVSRRGLAFATIFLLGASCLLLVESLREVRSGGSAVIAAAAGAGFGFFSALGIAVASALAVVRSRDMATQREWEKLTRHRNGGALWTRAAPEIREDLEGWKVARVVGEIVPRFVGLAFGSYPARASAECAHCDHQAPEPSCTCGFYAFYGPRRARIAWFRNRESVLLHVEGYGRAVEHQLGWRAEKQEVLSVTLPHSCRRCLRKAEGLARVPLFNEWLPYCVRCAERRGWKMLTTRDLCDAWGTEVYVSRGPRLGLANR